MLTTAVDRFSDHAVDPLYNLQGIIINGISVNRIKIMFGLK